MTLDEELKQLREQNKALREGSICPTCLRPENSICSDAWHLEWQRAWTRSEVEVLLNKAWGLGFSAGIDPEGENRHRSKQTRDGEWKDQDLAALLKES